MSTDPGGLRAAIAQLLSDLPDVSVPDVEDTAADADIDTVAARLEEAHELLVEALETIEKG